MTALAQLGLVTTTVGAVMIRLGLRVGLLESRRTRRRCPSCGRLLHRSVCRICAGG